MEAVGEALLSSLFEILLSKLQYPSDLLKYARQEKVHTELKKWGEMLSEMIQLLNVAEDKQIDDPSVQAWLERLRDLAYDMEDILEEFGYDGLRRKAMGEEDEGEVGGRSSKVCKFIPTCCTCAIFSTSPVKVVRNVEMGSKIMEITRRLEEISAQRTGLGLKCFDKVETITQSSSWVRRRLTTCEAYGPWVKGRDADKQAVIEMLLMTPDEGASATSNVSVASIVAMGGMGKTTLARLVYDDSAGAMAKHFDVRSWVCVSNDFDKVGVTKTLLNSFASERGHNPLDFHEIQSLLKKELRGKRFLIVLDDLWADIYSKWDDLRSPFMEGAPGSKILITTRDRDVAVWMGGRKNIHVLKQLSEDDCWQVFRTHAFEHANIHEHPNLEAIGRKIANKCGGLPLGAKALGGLLRCELREREWRRVLGSKIWDLPADKCDIIPALRLSYIHLPSHLKRCFAYCAIFPQDYEFKKKELIPLWMAQGLIQQSKDDDRSRGEELGDQYFCELFSRSFFQLSSSSDELELVFTMHDLVNDLAKYVAGDTCIHLDEEFKNNWQRLIPISTRHSSFVLGAYDTFKMFERFHKVEHLRSFMVVPTPPGRSLSNHISNMVLQQLIPRLGRLRALSLRNYHILEIPKEIGGLKLLKYLDLSGNRMKCLPDSIGNLYNLQTMILSNCYELTKLPDSIGGLYNLQTMELSGCRCLTRLPISIGNLVNLSRLIVSGCSRLEEMPSEVGKLKDLQILSDFMVGENNGLNIKKLREMSCLKGGLCISRLENVENIQDARDASLKLKDNLESLTLKWCSNLDGSRNDEIHQMNVLHYLEPPLNLNELCIRSYGGLAFPSWVSDASFSKLVGISLVECKNCATLPCLGQLPSLKRLRIDGMARVKEVGAWFYAEAGVSVDKCFPSLKSLTFLNMSEWEIWEVRSSAVEYSLFPCLQNLMINNCPKLIESLPSYLPHITNLIVHKCQKLEFPVLIVPSLKELDVQECNGAALRSGVVLTSLTKLSIRSISGLDKLHEGFVQTLQGLQDLTISASAELTCLWDDHDNDDGDGFGSENPPPHPLETRHCDQSLGCNLRSLRIFNCHKLQRLPNGWQKSLICLEELGISNCPKLVSFPKVGFPPNLKRLSLSRCRGLKSLPDGMMNRNNLCLLGSLNIRECSSLICFPKGQLPITLKTIWIDRCESFSCLPEGMMIQCYNQDSTLEDLRIASCPSLSDFPKGSLPTTLKLLQIVDCDNLKSLPEGMMILHQHCSSNMSTRVGLRLLDICKCPSLVSFPRGKFPSSLEILAIRRCEQLGPISEKMFHSLQSLTIHAYPNLKTLPDCLFDLSDLHISDCKNMELEPHQFQNFNRLQSLEIRGCKNIKTPLAQWGLSTLPSLKHFSIEDLFTNSDDPHPDLILLPSTLTSLSLSKLQKLESLSSLSLQNLTSLLVLRIYDCPLLQSILPIEGLLPGTLSQLWISGCPLLEKRCSKEGGDDWPKISHIPLVVVTLADV